MRALTVTAFLALAFTAFQAAAAWNMGFRLTLTLPRGTRFVSIPYRYTPADFGSPGVLDSEDLCRDLGAVTSIVRWVEASSQFVQYTCGSASGWFPLQEGTAYGVFNGGASDVTATLVGAHDNTFSYSLPATVGSNLSWVSIPYHARIPDVSGTPAGLDAEDVCQAVGSSIAFAVIRWDVETSLFVSYRCGSTLEEPFRLSIGEGYGLVNAAGQSISWQPPHY